MQAGRGTVAHNVGPGNEISLPKLCQSLRLCVTGIDWEAQLGRMSSIFTLFAVNLCSTALLTGHVLHL
jgi:hypothetical protein